MKRNAFLLLTAVILLLNNSYGQYTITAYSPPPQFVFDDLWHFTITRSNLIDTQKDFYLSVMVSNEQNLPISKSQSSVFNFSISPYYINTANLIDIKPITTIFYQSNILESAINSGGSFPPGNYNIRYELYGKPVDGQYSLLAEYNQQLTVDLLFPPNLLFPLDGDSIETTTPLLTWTPAFTNSNSNITYTIKIVRIYSGQTPYQSILSNPDMFTEGNLAQSTLLYPPTATSLDTNNSFAWQVYAYSGSMNLGSSEIWKFALKKPKKIPPPTFPKIYIKATDINNSDFVKIKEKYLPLMVDERYNPSENSKFTFKILNINKQVVGDQSDFDAVIFPGANKILVPICSSEGNISLQKGKYFIEMHMRQNIVFTVPFEIIEGNCND